MVGLFVFPFKNNGQSTVHNNLNNVKIDQRNFLDQSVIRYDMKSHMKVLGRLKLLIEMITQIFLYWIMHI